MPDSTSTPEPTISAVKGFSRDWKCRDFQFAIGQTYTHDGAVAACKSGFHACENPLDVFAYYLPGESRFATVTQSGDIARHFADSKIASARITIEDELHLPDLIMRSVQWLIDHATSKDVQHATGDRSAASATGDSSAAMSIGHDGRVLGKNGCALFLVYRDPNTDDILHAWAGIAGHDGIKVDVWYRLGSDGKPVEIA